MSEPAAARAAQRQRPCSCVGLESRWVLNRCARQTVGGEPQCGHGRESEDGKACLEIPERRYAERGSTRQEKERANQAAQRAAGARPVRGRAEAARPFPATRRPLGPTRGRSVAHRKSEAP